MRERPASQWKKHEPDSRAEAIQEEVKAIELYPLIGHYKPEFLGEGAEHAVFEIAGHPNIVAKIRTGEGAQIIRYNHENAMPPDMLDEKVKKDIERIMKEDEGRFLLLKEYFPDSFLNERQTVMQIPMTNELAKTLFGQTIPAFERLDSYTIPMRVRFQERIPQGAQKPEATDLKFRYLERRPISAGMYERLSGVLDGKITGEEYFSSYEEGEKMIKTLRENDGAKKALRDFVKRAIEYSEDTGEALDLAGQHNVILFDDKGTWRVILPDGMYPQKDLWSDAREVAEAYTTHHDLNSHDANVLMNGMNYARTINALADVVGIKERLFISRGTIPGTAMDLRYAILDAQSPLNG